MLRDISEAMTTMKNMQVTYLSLYLSILGVASCSFPGLPELAPDDGDDDGPTVVADSSPLRLELLAGTIGGLGNADDTGTAARFNYPTGVTVDSVGNVYVTDSNNHTIRKLSAAGAVTTLAGSIEGSADGTGTAARFANPYGVTVDSAGNVYVADWGNHTIRKVSVMGAVTTLAGTAGNPGSADGTATAARFNSPTGVTVDSAGNVYVADSGNHTIRKVSAAGVVTTLVGTAGNPGSADGTGTAARFTSPTGVTVDSAGNVYVADGGNHTIRKVSAAGAVTTLAGTAGNPGSADGTGTAARFANPAGVTVDSAGTVYVADNGNHTIRKVSPAGVVTTLAGTAGISGSADGTSTAARFNSPYSVTVDSAGNVYVADSSNHIIRKVSFTGVVTTLAGTAGIYGSTDGTGTAARFSYPTGMTVDSMGNVYVADSNNNTIRKVNPAGVVTTLAGTASISGSADDTGTAARFNSPYSVTVDSAGNLYVADTGNHTIRGVSAAGIVTTLAGTAGIFGNADGTGAVARFSNPTGVTVDSADNVYVADRGNHTIRKVSPTGTTTTIAGIAGASGIFLGATPRLASPIGLAIVADSIVISSGNAILLLHHGAQ